MEYYALYIYYFFARLNTVSALLYTVAIFLCFYFFKLKRFKKINRKLKEISFNNGVVIESALTYQDRARKNAENHTIRTVYNSNGFVEHLNVRNIFTLILLNDAWKFVIKNTGSSIMNVNLRFGYYDQYGRIGEGTVVKNVSTEQLRPNEERSIFFTVKDKKNKLKLEEIIVTPLSNNTAQNYTSIINLDLPKLWKINRVPSWPIALIMFFEFFPSLKLIGGWAFVGIGLCGLLAYTSAKERLPYTVLAMFIYLFSFYFEQYQICLWAAIYIGINYLKALSVPNFFKQDPYAL